MQIIRGFMHYDDDDGIIQLVFMYFMHMGAAHAIRNWLKYGLTAKTNS